MKRRQRFLVGLAALALVPMVAGPVRAGGCYATYYAPPVKVKTIIKKVYVDRVVTVGLPYYQPVLIAQAAPVSATNNYTINVPPPIAVAAKTISTTTVQSFGSVAGAVGVPVAAPVAHPVAAAPCPSHAELQARLDRLERQYSGHAPPPVAAAPQGDQGYDVGALLVRRCASCHDAGVSATKGHGLTLSQGGQLVRLDPATLQKCLAEVLSDRMPKGGPPLTQDEKYWVGVLVNQELTAPSSAAAAQ